MRANDILRDTCEWIVCGYAYASIREEENKNLCEIFLLEAAPHFDEQLREVCVCARAKYVCVCACLCVCVCVCVCVSVCMCRARTCV
jgi:hypothetical protein